MAEETWTKKRIPQSAAALGYAGAIPFIVASLLSWFPDPSVSEAAIIMLIGFSVVILSFMGGVRWGIAAGRADGPKFSHLVISLVPPAVAWLAMVLASDWMYSQADWLNRISPSLLENWRHAVQLVMMIAAFWILLMSDRRLKDELPGWYLGWRIPWTLLVEISLLAALARTIQLQVFSP